MMPRKKNDITIDFFENYVRQGVYEIFISPVVIDEINKTREDEKKQLLLNVISDYKINVLNISEKEDEIENLAYIYIEHKIIPERKIEDALHIAICTVMNIDILLSWNYKHLANINKESKIISTNITEGYSRTLRIITPIEVIYEK